MKPEDRSRPDPPRRKPRFLFNPVSPGKMERPKVEGMVLETEGGLRLADPPWGIVQSAVECLDAGGGNSFAVLSIGPGTFVQTLKGTNGFHLEWRISGDRPEERVHYRAADPAGPTVTRLLVKRDGLNDGQQRDLLGEEQVIGAFRAFFRREGPPRSLFWRTLDL